MINIESIKNYSIPHNAVSEEIKLLENIRESLLIQKELFDRIISYNSNISPNIVLMLEDLGNIYLSYSEEMASKLTRSKIKQ